MRLRPFGHPLDAIPGHRPEAVDKARDKHRTRAEMRKARSWWTSIRHCPDPVEWYPRYLYFSGYTNFTPVVCAICEYDIWSVVVNGRWVIIWIWCDPVTSTSIPSKDFSYEELTCRMPFNSYTVTVGTKFWGRIVPWKETTEVMHQLFQHILHECNVIFISYTLCLIAYIHTCIYYICVYIHIYIYIHMCMLCS